MCAINGITWTDEDCVLKMNTLTRHRGPDGTSVYKGEGFTFGHNRLAIIDVSEASSQPMKSADGRYVIVFNGEIYNYKELRNELSSQYVFTTNGDTEVLLAAYAIWGESMLPRLRGIFAFGVWDTIEKSLLLARDHMGVKPLYWSEETYGIKFSSELQAFLLDSNQLCKNALSMYLALEYIPSPFTAVDGVYKISPGHVLRYKNGVATTDSYVNIFDVKSASGQNNIYDVIDAAVKQQLVSDRPVGIFLSGGLDSSIVLHHAQKYQQKISTFSVSFDVGADQKNEDIKFNSDAVLAKKTADIYGVGHVNHRISTQDVEDGLLSMYELLDEPIADSSGFPRYMLSKFIREQGVVVALGGEGGDELFGGYNRHRAMISAYYLQMLPQYFQKLIAGSFPKAKKLLKEFPVPIHLAYMAPGIEDAKFFRKSAIDTESMERFFGALYNQAPKSMHPVDAFMRVDRFTWMSDLTLALSDRFSMANGVEFRVPLLSTDVVDVSDQISVYKKTTPFKGKKVLREIYKAHLPEHLFNQPKRGWIAPEAKWLRYAGVQKAAKEILSADYYDGLNDIFNWSQIQGAFENHLDGSAYNRRLLWNILVLQIWARKNKICQ